MARPRGKAKAKRAINKELFNKLLLKIETAPDSKIRVANKAKLKIAFTLLYCTGCRISEIINFTSYDLEKIFKTKTYTTDNKTKTNRSRLIRFTDSQIELLKKYNSSSTGYLFFKNNSTYPMTITGLKNLCNEYIHLFLGENYSTHSFRRNVVTTLLKKTGRVSIAREHIGHKSSATTTLYDVPDDEDIQEALDSVDW